MIRAYNSNGEKQAFDSVKGMHADTACRLISARERLESMGVGTAALKPAEYGQMARLQERLGCVTLRNPSSQPCLTQQDIVALESDLEHEVERVMAIIALMMQDMQADIQAMEDMMHLITVLDDTFFRMTGTQDMLDWPHVLNMYLANKQDTILT